MLIAFAVILSNSRRPDVKIVRTTPELLGALREAKPGTTIQIAPGEYRGGQAVDIHGTEPAPIRVMALDLKSPPTFVGALQFSRVSFLELSGFVILGATSNGLNIDDGGTIKMPSHHVKVSSIIVRDLPTGNHDGIKLSGIDDFEVRDCLVEKWGGSGIDMVGCHRGKLVNCGFRSGGDSGVQAKGGSSEITIERCRFEDFGQRGVNIGGSAGLQFFRPPVDSLPANARFEARNITVQGCTFVRGGAPVAFVGVDGATVRLNTMYRPGRWAFRILQETTSPGFVPSRRGVFSENLVVFRAGEWSAGGVNIGSGTAPETFSFERNFWYCTDLPSASKPKLPVAETNGLYGQDPLFVDPNNGDFRVKNGSAASKAGAQAFR
jgi:hypothetical protein